MTRSMLLLLGWGLAGLVEAAQPEVQICLGRATVGPFTYWERKDGVPDTRRLTGSATTQVLEALKSSGCPTRSVTCPGRGCSRSWPIIARTACAS